MNLGLASDLTWKGSESIWEHRMSFSFSLVSRGFAFVEKPVVWPLPWAVSASASVSLDHRHHIVWQVPLSHCWAICSDKLGH